MRSFESSSGALVPKTLEEAIHAATPDEISRLPCLTHEQIDVYNRESRVISRYEKQDENLYWIGGLVAAGAVVAAVFGFFYSIWSSPGSAESNWNYNNLVDFLEVCLGFFLGGLTIVAVAVIWPYPNITPDFHSTHITTLKGVDINGGDLDKKLMFEEPATRTHCAICGGTGKLSLEYKVRVGSWHTPGGHYPQSYGGDTWSPSERHVIYETRTSSRPCYSCGGTGNWQERDAAMVDEERIAVKEKNVRVKAWNEYVERVKAQL